MHENLRILILADAKEHALLLEHELRQEKIAFESKHLRTEKAFLRHLDSFGPDIAVLTLPATGEKGGKSNIREVLRQAKSSASGPQIILLASPDEELEAIDLVKAGADDYMLTTSPARIRLLAGKITKKPACKDPSEKHQEVSPVEKEFSSLLTEFDGQLFSHFFEIVPGGIMVVDKSGQIKTANREALKILGIEGKQIIGKQHDSPRWKFMTPDGKKFPDEKKPFVRVMKTAKPVFGIEQLVERPDGIKKIISINADPLLDRQGNVIAVIAAISDLTARKETEKALKESEDTFRRIVEGLSLGVHMYRLEADGRLIFSGSNRSADNILGVENNQFIGKEILDAFPLLKETDIPHRYREIAEKGGHWHFEHSYTDGDVSGIFIVDAFQIDARRVAVTFVDVTEMVRVQQALREGQMRYEMATTAGRVGVWGYNVETKEMFIDPQLKAMLGYFEHEIENHIDKWLELVYWQDRQKVLDALNNHLSGQTPYFDVEHRMVQKDGAILWILARGTTAIWNEAGNPVRMMGTAMDITERKLAEQIVRDGELKYRLLAENASDVISTFDLNLNYTYISPSIERLLGYTQDDVVALTVKDVLVPSSYELVVKSYKDWVKKVQDNDDDIGYQVRMELEHLRKDGTTIWTEVVATAIRNSKGIPIGILCVTRDISDRKRAEEALRLSEEKFAKAFWSSPEHMCITSLRDGTFFDVNESFLKLTGFTQAEIIGKTAKELGIWGNQLDRQKVYDLIKEQGSFRNFEVIARRKNDETCNVLLSAELITINEEPYIISTAKDITESKRAQERIFFQASLLDQVRNSVIVTDLSNRIIFWNKYSEILFQWSEKEVLSKNYDMVLYDTAIQSHPKLSLADVIRFVRENGYWEGEKLVKRKDGKEVICYCAITLLKDTTGVPTGIIHVCSDIGERKQLEEQLHHSQKMEAIGRLTGGVAHDYNNLLAVILGSADILYKRLDHEEPLHKQVVRIKASATRASSLTKKLLSFSRQKALDTKIVDLNQCIESVLWIVEHTVDRRIRVVKDLMDNLPMIVGDESQIELLMLNLAMNACDAMEPVLDSRTEGILRFGTTVKPIDYFFAEKHQLDQQKPYLHLAISDTGIGIPEEIREKIFEPFFTTKDAERGTGLGLSIVYGTVKSHQGAIHLESQLGEGTTFHIYFPVVEEK